MSQFVVIAIEEDGTHSAWGPLSEHRADQAIAAFEAIGIAQSFALLLRPSSALSAEVPDWKRMVA